MTAEQFAELMVTVRRMRDTADALFRSCHMFATVEKDAARYAYFHRLHVALNDCALALRRTMTQSRKWQRKKMAA
jgi:hypothetical protein